MNSESLGRFSLRRTQISDQLFDPTGSQVVARHVRPFDRCLVLIDRPAGILGCTATRVINVTHKSRLHGFLPGLCSFFDQFPGTIQISHSRLDEGGHAKRHHPARNVSCAPGLLDRRSMMLDATLRVPEPLSHLAGDMREPALARLGAGGFRVQTPFNKSRSLLSITFVVKGVAGRRRKENWGLFELITPRPCQDPLVPTARLRSSMRI